MKQLIAALENNWEGYEDIRKMCLEAPKFGNDDDYVDLISIEVAKRVTQETMSARQILERPSFQMELWPRPSGSGESYAKPHQTGGKLEKHYTMGVFHRWEVEIVRDQQLS